MKLILFKLWHLYISFIFPFIVLIFNLGPNEANNWSTKEKIISVFSLFKSRDDSFSFINNFALLCTP